MVPPHLLPPLSPPPSQWNVSLPPTKTNGKHPPPPPHIEITEPSLAALTPSSHFLSLFLPHYHERLYGDWRFPFFFFRTESGGRFYPFAAGSDGIVSRIWCPRSPFPPLSPPQEAQYEAALSFFPLPTGVTFRIVR